VRPNLVLRRLVEEPEIRKGWLARLAESKAQWITAAIILLGLGAIAAALSDSVVVGRWFAGALCALLIVILAVSAFTLRVVRAFLARTRLHLTSALRHGLANLYRPGNQSAAVLAALGLGVMLILTVFLMQKSVVGEMKMTSGPNLPNVFLIDISSRELAGVRSLLSHQPAVHGALETLPVVSGRIVSVDGTAEAGLKLKNYPRRLLQTVAMTWSPTLPEGSTMVSGKWWDRDDAQSMAVTQHIAERLHLHLGSVLVFSSGGRTVTATVVAVIRHNGQHVYGRSEFILTPRALAGLPVVWYGAAHVDPRQVGAVQRALFNAYPTVTVINIADVIETVQSVVQQITIVVRFLAAFSILAGALILASSIASTQFRRVREVVVLKTLGARRNHIATVFTVEFVVLGLLAGFVGVIFANLLSRVLLRRLDVEFHMEWLATAVALAGTAILATVTGWIASYRMLGQKPLQVLREE
jgi:putative ABC transport system permease protein